MLFQFIISTKIVYVGLFDGSPFERLELWDLCGPRGICGPPGRVEERVLNDKLIHKLFRQIRRSAPPVMDSDRCSALYAVITKGKKKICFFFSLYLISLTSLFFFFKSLEPIGANTNKCVILS